MARAQHGARPSSEVGATAATPSLDPEVETSRATPSLDHWFARLDAGPLAAELVQSFEPSPWTDRATGNLYFSGNGRVVVELRSKKRQTSWCVNSEADDSDTYYTCLLALFDRARLRRDYLVTEDSSGEVSLTARVSTLGCRRALLSIAGDRIKLVTQTKGGHRHQTVIDIQRPGATVNARCARPADGGD
ncbi:MAG TPA: hypothetical protein PKD61_07770 [Polyangiaceae bacterium]|nr:hypothetical protein [Polyangiaceae bacterium]